MQSKTDEIFLQWNDILNESLIVPEFNNDVEKNHEYLLKWLEKRLNETLSHPVNSSDKLDLQLRMAYTQVVTREVAKVSEILKESKNQHNKNSLRRSSQAEVQTKVSNHSNSLMKLKDELAQKMKQLDRLRSLLSDLSESVDEYLKLIQLITKRDDSEEDETFNLLRIKVEQKMSLVSELNTLYNKIRSDVEENYLVFNEDISKKWKILEEKWEKLTTKCRNIGINVRSGPNYTKTNKSLKLIRDRSTDDRVEGFSPVSQMSSASCDTEAIITSRTTYSNSQSSFLSEEVLPPHISQNDEQLVMVNTLIHDIKNCLGGILRHILNNRADASDQNSVKDLLRRYQGNLQEIDAKKTRLAGLIDLLKYKDTDLQNNFDACEEQYATSKAQILARVSELIQLTSDVEQFIRKQEETMDIIKNAEKDLLVNGNNDKKFPMYNGIENGNGIDNNSNPPTNDNYVSKNKHRVKLFVQCCTKIISTYTKDDTTEIQLVMEDIIHRHEQLVQSEKNQENKSKATEIRLSNNLSSFYEWLAMAEKVAQEIDIAAASTPKISPDKLSQRLTDLKQMVAEKDGDFDILRLEEESNLSQKYVQMHNRKVEEITLRWKNLQNKILGLSIHNPKEDPGFDETLEKENINPSTWSNMFSAHESWLRDMKKELTSLVIAGDSATILKQIDQQKILKLEVENKISEIKDKLEDYEMKNNKNIEPEAFSKNSGKLEGMIRSLVKLVEQWGIKLGDNHMKISILETSMNNLSYKLNQIGLDSKGLNNKEGIFSYEDDLEALENDLSNLLSQEQELQTTLSSQNRIMFESLKDRVNNLTSSQQKEPETYCLPNGWERGIQDEIPYFINHLEESTQWDHPVFTELMSSLNELNNVKFSAYRMALKLRQIQKKLCLEHLDLESAMFGFEMHGLTSDRYCRLLS